MEAQCAERMGWAEYETEVVLSMKKLMVLAVALLMICSVALAETPEISQEDFTLDLNQKHMVSLDLIDESAMSIGEADSVIRDGNKYIVNNGTIEYRLDLEKFPTLLCFTQNKMASFEAYLRVGDPESLLEYLIDEEINFYLVDMETKMQVYIYPHEGDKLSAFTGDLSQLDPQNQELIASMMASNPVIKKAGDVTWIVANEAMMLTIFKNQYICVEFGGSGDPEGDLADTLDLLADLNLE